MSEQPDEQYDHKRKPRFSLKAILAAVAAVIALGASAVQVVQYIEDHNKPKLERFEESSLESSKKAVEFADFLKRNDSKVVYISIECPYVGEADIREWPEGMPMNIQCYAQESYQYPADKLPETRWYIGTGPYTIHDMQFERPSSRDEGDAWRRSLVLVEVTIPDDSDAKQVNGPKGAGYLTAKGYFSVTRTAFGDAPQEATHYALRGVNSSAVQER